MWRRCARSCESRRWAGLRAGVRSGLVDSNYSISSLGIVVTGGELVASNVTASGGHAWAGSNAAPAVGISGGKATFSDCHFTGGNAMPYYGTVAGEPALVSSGASTFLTRTTLVPGVGTTPPSSGFQVVDEMVGMSVVGSPTLGSSMQAVATAGTSQQLLGIVGGFDRTPNHLAAIAQPLFGNPAQLVTLTLAIPAPGATVTESLTIPNIPALVGEEVWLQALQLANSQIHASTVVGGAIL